MKIRHCAALLIAFGVGAVAQAQPANFEQKKEQELARIDAHLQLMHQTHDCVQAAQNHAALKACNEQEKAGMAALRQQFAPPPR